MGRSSGPTLSRNERMARRAEMSRVGGTYRLGKLEAGTEVPAYLEFRAEMSAHRREADAIDLFLVAVTCPT